MEVRGDGVDAGKLDYVQLSYRGDPNVAHAYDCCGPTGLEKLTAGNYDLVWFDTTSDRTVKQAGVQTAAGACTWSKPEALGTEIALYVRRQN